MATKKTSKRAPGQPGGREYPGQGYRVLVITRLKDTPPKPVPRAPSRMTPKQFDDHVYGHENYSVRRVGHFAKGVQRKDVLSTLKKLAPKKSTTAVAITKTGTIHLAARARKLVRAGKGNQQTVYMAIRSSRRAPRITVTSKARKKTSRKR